MTVTIDDIRRAAALIRETIAPTPVLPAARLSERAGARLHLKLETVHPTGSFKERGALAKLLSLPADAARTGVVAMSAGNHAQGVARHAARLGIPATIVMPAITPFTKIERTEALGARVVLHGATLAEARAHADTLAARDGLTFIHPYDDPMVVAGQGTIGLELAEQLPDVEAVVLPIGGGGLAAGIAVALRALRPEVRLWGAQSALFPAMRQALRGETPSSGGDTLAEGIAVGEPGRLPRALLAGALEDVVLVDEAAIEQAVHLIVAEQKIVAEGAGAVPLAAVLARQDAFRGRRIALVVGGGNIDDRMLSFVLMRGLARDGRLVRIRVELTDAPGALSRMTQLIGDAGGNIVEIYHQRLFSDVPVKHAEVDAVIETRNLDHAQALLARLSAAGFPARRMGFSLAEG